MARTAIPALTRAALIVGAVLGGAAACLAEPDSPGAAPTPATEKVEDAANGLACGSDRTCDPAREYCSVFIGGPAGIPPDHRCAPLPADCPSPPTCECIPEAVIGCRCVVSPEGELTLTCTAP
jgi:hypothetical protein